MASKGIYWLASYPKSGNTWMRVLLSNYLGDGRIPANINDLALRHTAGCRNLLDDLAGVELSDFTRAEVDEHRPEIYREWVRRASSNLYVKAHDAFLYNLNGLCCFPRDVSAGVVYLARNPLDVAVSFAHHASLTCARIVHVMADPRFTLAPDGVFNHIHQRVTSWSGHVKSWLEESQLPLIVVRYEDLVAEPVQQLSRTVRFLGLPLDEERLKKAVDYSSLEALRKQEATAGFTEKPPGCEHFFRKGQTSTWKDELPNFLAQRLIKDHGEMMRTLGYLDELGQLVY